MIAPEDMARIRAAADPRSRNWSPDEFSALLFDETCFAVGDERAFALVRVVLDEAELLTLATHPDHQRQGLARGLMEAWHERAQDRGAVRGFLEVAADNLPATRLYVACGYDVIGLRLGYYARPDGPPVDAVLMGRTFP